MHITCISCHGITNTNVIKSQKIYLLRNCEMCKSSTVWEYWKQCYEAEDLRNWLITELFCSFWWDKWFHFQSLEELSTKSINYPLFHSYKNRGSLESSITKSTFKTQGFMFHCSTGYSKFVLLAVPKEQCKEPKENTGQKNCILKDLFPGLHWC